MSIHITDEEKEILVRVKNRFKIDAASGKSTNGTARILYRDEDAMQQVMLHCDSADVVKSTSKSDSGCDRNDALIAAGSVIRDRMNRGELTFGSMTSDQLTALDAWEQNWFDRQRGKIQRNGQLPSSQRKDGLGEFIDRSAQVVQSRAKVGDSPTMAARKNRQLPRTEFSQKGAKVETQTQTAPQTTMERRKNAKLPGQR